METVAPTDDLLWGVDAAQYELLEGPRYEAAVDSVHVLAPDLASDDHVVAVVRFGVIGSMTKHLSSVR